MSCCPLKPDIPDSPTLAPPPPPADYSEAYNLQAKSMEYATDVMEKQTQIAIKQGRLVAQTYKYWQNKVAPLQAKVMKDVRRGLPTEPYEARARNAAIQQSSGAGRAGMTALAGRGVDPSSPMAVSRLQDQSARAGSAAGMAQYGARRRIEDVNRGRRMSAYGMGANIPAQTITNLGTAAGVVGRAAVPVMNSYTNLANAHMAEANAEAQMATQAWSLSNQNLMNQWNRDVQQANAEAGLWNSVFQTGATIGAIKLTTGTCIPEGGEVDVPGGAALVSRLRVGDAVIGADGEPCAVLIVTQYLNPPDHMKPFGFSLVQLSTGDILQAGNDHVVCGKPLGEYRKGDQLGEHTIVAIVPVPEVRVSYDLVTSGPGGGYSMAGVPVDSMVEKLVLKAKV